MVLSQKLKSGVSKGSTLFLKPVYGLLRNKLGVSKFFASVLIVYLLMPGVILDIPPTGSASLFSTSTFPLGLLNWVSDPLGLIPANNVSALIHAFVIVVVFKGFLSMRQ